MNYRELVPALKRKNKMLTLMQIDALTSSHDGSTFSDLYKDVYGVRPRNVTFESLEAFDRDFTSLYDMLDEKIAHQQKMQAVDWERFQIRLERVMQANGCAARNAVLVIGVQEGFAEKELDNYGFEILEDHLGLKYSSILDFLESVE